MPNYVTVDEFTAWANVYSGSASFDTTSFDHVLDAAEAAVEDHCGRVFTTDSSATQRLFRALSKQLVVVDDIHSTDGLVVETDDGGTGSWTSTSDYQLEPLNGVVNGRSGWPYTFLRATDLEEWPAHKEARVRVTAKWGWAAVPNPVKNAVRIMALRLWRRRMSPEGIAGFEDFGGVRVSRLDPDVQRILAPYVRIWDEIA